MRQTGKHSVLSVLTLSFGAALAAGCAVAAEGEDETPTAAAQGAVSSGPHLMPTSPARAARPEARAGARGFGRGLIYFGGPIIQNVNVVPVYWNSSVSLQSNLNAFYSAVSTGSYIGFFSQYDTTFPRQTIGNGTRGTPYVDNQIATSVTDAQVQAELASLFTAGSLPAPTSNNLYMVHFPSGVTITSGSDVSCVTFCAYHGTFTHNGQDVYYGVLPDLSARGCNGGCGGSTVANNTTSVASHEFAEALTDPAVGLATFIGPQLGWYSIFGGEIGDLCNGQQGQATLGDGKTYTVQKLWSDRAGACVVP